jgi:5-methyltetrahydropteroyltriglutamate--homocysteine methyltransferase
VVSNRRDAAWDGSPEFARRSRLKAAVPRPDGHERRTLEDVELVEDKLGDRWRRHPPATDSRHPELVAHRPVRLANLVGRDRLVTHTDSGSAQHATTRPVPISTPPAKRRALVDGRRLATGKLLGADWRSRER